MGLFRIVVGGPQDVYFNQWLVVRLDHEGVAKDEVMEFGASKDDDQQFLFDLRVVLLRVGHGVRGIRDR